MAKQKGGVKLRRSKNRKTKYAAQYVRTKRNKIAQLRKRLSFDPTAEPAMRKWNQKSTQGRDLP